jgi:L-fuculose-phosphate aldolase
MSGEFELKKQLVEIGKRIWTQGYVAANDGNISVLLNDRELLTTPTGVSKGFMTPDMIIKCDRDGKVISGNPKYRPSSEVKMHLEVYKERPDVRSVVHAHPTYATSFAVAGIPLDKCVLPEAIIVIGSVPIAPYGLPSTMEIPDKMRPFIKNSDAILMENHGALTMGSDLLNAYFKMETLEHTASIVWKAMQLGNVNVMSTHERDRLMSLRERFNLTSPITVCNTDPLKPELRDIPVCSSPSDSETNDISEQDIKTLVEKVLLKLKMQ